MLLGNSKFLSEQMNTINGSNLFPDYGHPSKNHRTTLSFFFFSPLQDQLKVCKSFHVISLIVSLTS